MSEFTDEEMKKLDTIEEYMDFLKSKPGAQVYRSIVRNGDLPFIVTSERLENGTLGVGLSFPPALTYDDIAEVINKIAKRVKK